MPRLFQWYSNIAKYHGGIGSERARERCSRGIYGPTQPAMRRRIARANRGNLEGETACGG